MASSSSLGSIHDNTADKSSCPIISYDEAMKREIEFRKRVKRFRECLLADDDPIITMPSNGSSALMNTVQPLERTNNREYSSLPGTMNFEERPSFHPRITEHVTRPPQTSQPRTNAGLLPRPPENLHLRVNIGRIPKPHQHWQPARKKLQVPQPPSQLISNSRPNLTPSFWCKICKVDCTSEHNFRAHIGGKKHTAKKLEILGGGMTGRDGSHLEKNNGGSSDSGGPIVSGEPEPSSKLNENTQDLPNRSDDPCSREINPEALQPQYGEAIEDATDKDTNPSGITVIDLD